MTHLTVDEIIDFVSISKMDIGSMELASRVNTHIRGCDDCLKKVRAFQLIYDELTKVGVSVDFKTFVYKIVSDESVDESVKSIIGDNTNRRHKQD